MSENSAIGWTDATWNPVTGCSKVSEGCRNCYAEALSLRFGRSKKPWSAQFAAENVVLHPERLGAPLKLKKPSMVFVNSMSDLFHELVPDEFIDRVFAVMAWTPRHTYQILTKRPERMAAYFAARFEEPSHPGTTIWKEREDRVSSAMCDACTDTNGRLCGFGNDDCQLHLIPWPLPNVWLGTSVENQAAADERIPHLLRTPAAVRFLSCEPLLGPVDLQMVRVGKLPGQIGEFDQFIDAVRGRHCDGMGFERDLKHRLDWVITGGESGPRHRTMDLDWARQIIEQCQSAGVATYVKQDSGLYPGKQGRIPDALWKHEFPEARVAALAERGPRA